MNSELKKALSLLNTYISGYSGSGFSKDDSGKILELCALGDSPFRRMTDTFGCEKFDTAALITGLLVTLSRSAGQKLSAAFGTPLGYVTPSVISALFFGIDDIAPFTSSLQTYSPLYRLMTGVECRCGAGMRLRDFAADFAVRGAVYDEVFLPAQNRNNLIPIGSQEKAVKEISSFLHSRDAAEPFVLLVCGEAGSGRHTCAGLALSSLELSYIPLHFSDEPDAERLSEISAKLLLTGCIPVISGDIPDETLFRVASYLADEVGFVVLIAGAPNSGTAGVPTGVIEIDMPSMQEQYLLWQQETLSYSIRNDADLSELSGEYDMNPGGIIKALKLADVLSEGRPLRLSDIKAGCSRSFGTDMGDKATKLPPVYSWDDIVLPAQSKKLLTEACQQVKLRHRIMKGWGFSKTMPYGNGVSMIFTGPPGTGKTMAARILAGELGMDIYRISLAGVVSKYIGETEKNLNEIFDKARLTKCILFFDEADVLFSKRTEVREANDKYSNMESAFLLQKTESYSGVVILATNLVQNFDEAFKRRMRFLIDFPLPDAGQRREIWQKVFPKEAPLDNIDFGFLSETFQLSGSNIRNIALHSAFLAAGEGSPAIGMKHILEAVRNEYIKSGKSFTRAEAGEYFYDIPLNGE